MPNDPIRLEPCDLPSAEEKDKQMFRIRDEPHDCCDLCERRVATREFDNGQSSPGCPSVGHFCRVCFNLHHANSIFYPDSFPHKRLVQDIMTATRAIIREELTRGRAI